MPAFGSSTSSSDSKASRSRTAKVSKPRLLSSSMYRRKASGGVCTQSCAKSGTPWNCSTTIPSSARSRTSRKISGVHPGTALPVVGISSGSCRAGSYAGPAASALLSSSGDKPRRANRYPSDRSFARASGPKRFPHQAKLTGLSTPTRANWFSTRASSPSMRAAFLGTAKLGCDQEWLPISKPISAISAISSHDMKFSRSSIHRWVTKKVAENPRSERSGATKCRCDLTASSNVRTAVGPEAEQRNRATPPAVVANRSRSRREQSPSRMALIVGLGCLGPSRKAVLPPGAARPLGTTAGDTLGRSLASWI